MGNWRTVFIEGTLEAAEVPRLIEALELDSRLPVESWAPLATGPLGWTKDQSLFGLHRWPAAQMMVGGNLSERDFTVENVADHLENLAAIAPSLRVKVHCGGDYEDTECVATITVDERGATIGEPEREFVVGVSPRAAADRMLGMLVRPALAPEPLLPPSLGIAGFIDRTGEEPLLSYTLPDDEELITEFAQAMDAAKEAFLAKKAGR